MKTKKLITISFLFLFSLRLHAQSPMEIFKKYAGDWNATISMWMTANDSPMSDKLSVHCEMSMNDLFFTMNYSGTMMDMKYEAVHTIGYDLVKKKFVSTFIDNMNSGIDYKEGTLSADKKTIGLFGTAIDPATGKSLVSREVITFVDDKQMKIEDFTSYDGNERKTLETNLMKR